MALKLGIVFLIFFMAQSSLRGHPRPFGSLSVGGFLQLKDEIIETSTLLETSETVQSLINSNIVENESGINFISTSNDSDENTINDDEAVAAQSVQETAPGSAVGVVAMQCACEKCDHEANQMLVSVPSGGNELAAVQCSCEECETGADQALIAIPGDGTAVAAVQCSCEECDMEADQSLIAVPSDGSAVAAIQCNCEECDLNADQRLLSVPNDINCHCCE